MAITPINNFKNILDKLQNVFITEFNKMLPVYIGHKNIDKGTQYLRLEPVSNTLLEYAAHSEAREYNIDLFYHSNVNDVEKVGLDNVFRVVARIEALIHDNITMTLADSSIAYDCKIDTTEYNTDEESEQYVVTLNYNCKHTGNVA